jgi:hypothetical protein
MSRAHDFSFRGAIYLPMVAGMLAYTRLAPVEYEGKPYLAINCGGEITSIGGLTAAAWVIAYLAWTLWRDHSERAIAASQKVGLVHPGEWWGARSFQQRLRARSIERIVSVGLGRSS